MPHAVKSPYRGVRSGVKYDACPQRSPKRRPISPQYSPPPTPPNCSKSTSSTCASSCATARCRATASRVGARCGSTATSCSSGCGPSPGTTSRRPRSTTPRTLRRSVSPRLHPRDVAEREVRLSTVAVVDDYVITADYEATAQLLPEDDGTDHRVDLFSVVLE